jgi:hypothetical protein
MTPYQEGRPGRSFTDEEPSRVSTHRKKRSLLRRAIYFVLMMVTGGGAGVGGWALKDHPRLQALIGMVLGGAQKPGAEEGELKTVLAAAVKGAIAGSDGRRPGVYQVRISELALDPKLFTQGRTVDIQVRVRKVDADGREATVWESKGFGEKLAVVGKDDLAFDWKRRPFEIDWAPGTRVIVEVWNRKGGLLDQREFKMASPEPGVFPLTSGVHALEVAGRSRATRDSDLNRIAFKSERVGELSGEDSPRQVAERPIVIK